MKKPEYRCGIAREEYIAITGDFIAGIILNQLIYWSGRVRDNVKFIEEEERIASMRGKTIDSPLAYGWIYKTSAQLAEELVLPVSVQTIRRHISKLVKLGFLAERNNPKHRWDRTLQYRVNLNAIKSALAENGYELPKQSKDVSVRNPAISKLDVPFTKKEHQSSILDEQYQRLYPKTTDRDYVKPFAGTDILIINQKKTSELLEYINNKEKELDFSIRTGSETQYSFETGNTNSDDIPF